MVAEALDVSGEVEQMTLVDLLGMHGVDLKHAMGEGARLVEDHRLHLSQRVHIGRPLDEDTLPRSPTDAAEEREGHGDDQRTRT